MEKFRAKKSLGQNFLIDNNIIKKIVNLENLKNRNVIEIGPGKGALTDEILKKKPRSLYLIEKDFYLFNELKKKYKLNKKIKIFIQVNIGNENQKSGVRQDKLDSLVNYCKELNLEVIGLMCIPPIHEQSAFYFKKMSELNNHFSFSEISMGMSSDYLTAVQNSATYIRVGSSIFGERI